MFEQLQSPINDPMQAQHWFHQPSNQQPQKRIDELKEQLQELHESPAMQEVVRQIRTQLHAPTSLEMLLYSDPGLLQDATESFMDNGVVFDDKDHPYALHGQTLRDQLNQTLCEKNQKTKLTMDENKDHYFNPYIDEAKATNSEGFFATRLQQEEENKRHQNSLPSSLMVI